MVRIAAFQYSPSEPLGYIEQIFSDADVLSGYNYLMHYGYSQPPPSSSILK